MGIGVMMTNDNVLIRPELMDKSKGGIIIPDSANKKDRPTRGVVLEVGEGKNDQTGKFVKMPYRPGMRVLFHQYPSLFIDDPDNEGDLLYIVAQTQIVGVLTDKGGK